MSDMSKASRAAMRAKASRMASGDPHKKVDASSWTPSEPLNTTAKTGARPIRPRIYKAGGRIQGDRGPKRADKAPREAKDIINAKINRDVVTANAELGKPHVGAFKKGGRAHRDMGGGMQDPRAQAQAAMAAANQRSGTSPNRMDFGNARSGVSKLIGLKKGGTAEKHESYKGGSRPTGGRIAKASGGKTGSSHWMYQPSEETPSLADALKQKAIHPDTTEQQWGQMSPGMRREIARSSKKSTGARAERKDGGRAKGKTNINIVIAQPHGQPQQAPNNAPVRPPMPPPQMPPPPPQMPMGAPPGGPGGPPMPPPSMAGGPAGGMPMMPRKRGGRTMMTAGAGSGPGRLEKIALQKGSQ